MSGFSLSLRQSSLSFRLDFSCLVSPLDGYNVYRWLFIEFLQYLCWNRSCRTQGLIGNSLWKKHPSPKNKQTNKQKKNNKKKPSWFRGLHVAELNKMWSDETEVMVSSFVCDFQHVKLTDVSHGSRQRDSLVADEDVKKTTNQPTNQKKKKKKHRRAV